LIANWYKLVFDDNFPVGAFFRSKEVNLKVTDGRFGLFKDHVDSNGIAKCIETFFC